MVTLHLSMTQPLYLEFRVSPIKNISPFFRRRIWFAYALGLSRECFYVSKKVSRFLPFDWEILIIICNVNCGVSFLWRVPVILEGTVCAAVTAMIVRRQIRRFIRFEFTVFSAVWFYSTSVFLLGENDVTEISLWLVDEISMIICYEAITPPLMTFQWT